MNQVEQHPLQPFLPHNARALFLGSFPPPQKRWSMEFYYPNFQNDMWRILGTIFYANPLEFVVEGEKKFDYQKIVDFCNEKGLAIFDTATAVRRLQDNASDKFLEVVEETDLEQILAQIPQCKAIVTTGEKATDVLVAKYSCEKPKVAASVLVEIGGKTYDFFRMPSSSRAYPLSLAKKAEAYGVLKKFFE